MTIDPLALVYAGLQVYKVMRDDKRFDAEMEALKAKNLDAPALLEELRRMRDLAAAEARAAIDRMVQ